MTIRMLALTILLLSQSPPHDLYAEGFTIENQNEHPPSLEAIQQKLQLVKTLLDKSPSIERATHSDDTTANQITDKARILYADAIGYLKAGNTSQAEASLDAALLLIEKASRMSPDPLQEEAKLRARYAELKEGLQSLQSTYHELRHRLFPNIAAAPPIDASLEDIHSMSKQAQILALDRHFKEAGDVLQNAHAAAITALNKLMGSNSLMYELKFQTDAEEFDYEMARYSSYEDLAPIAYNELKPGEDSIKLSERYVQESHTIRDAAKQQAKQGDLRTAINSLQEAIKRIQTALRIVGLILPE